MNLNIQEKFSLWKMHQNDLNKVSAFQILALTFGPLRCIFLTIVTPFLYDNVDGSLETKLSINHKIMTSYY